LQPKSQNIETLHEIQILTTALMPAPLSIDIHIFVPDNIEASHSSLPLSQINFQKVGRLQFQQGNDSTDGIQVKSAFMNHQFFLLKLSLYGC